MMDTVLTKDTNRELRPEFRHRHKTSKNTLNRLEMIVNQRGGKCLTRECKRSKDKVLIACDQKHIWEASVASIVYLKSWCPSCAGNQKLTLAELQTIAQEQGGQCLSLVYINTKTKMLWQCAEHHQWFATAFSVRTRKSWCPTCYRNKKK